MVAELTTPDLPTGRVAVIDEALCIGCTLCIAACPVDAILGAPKRMHAVLSSLCTGCELCVAPCPVDCIAMLPTGREWTAADAEAALERSADRSARLSRNERISRRVGNTSAEPGRDAHLDNERARRQAAVAAALLRARARRGIPTPVKP